MKKTIYSIIIALSLIVCCTPINVFASSDKSDKSEKSEISTENIEDMTYLECKQVADYMISDIIAGRNENLSTYEKLFTEDAITEFLSYIDKSNVKGTVSSVVIDWVYPEYSSSEDSVMFINYKVYDGSYNNVYLLELHINKSGKIYGYNVWAY